MGLMVALGLAAAAAVALAWWIHEQRRKHWAQAARDLGFQYATDDPFGLVGLPFELFGRGDGRGVENVVWGRDDEGEVRAFDYWYYDVRTDHQGHRRRDYSRFTCAVVDVALVAPGTSVTPETILTRLADLVGFRDIEFESEEFNERWQVKSADRRFASYLVDARMIEWLLDGAGSAFEIAGNALLCYRGRMNPTDVPSLLSDAREFRARIPRVALDTFGAGA